MKLQIRDPDNELDLDFGHWLIRRIQLKFLADLDARKLVRWDEFLDRDPRFKESRVRADRILQLGVRSLRVKKIPGYLEIFLSKNTLIPGADRIKLEVLCRLITFGNQSISGYSVLLKTLQHFATNINYYIELYEEGVE